MSAYGLCDEYIAVYDVKQYASDMDCFQPLIERFYNIYGEYPEYPVADAGYGSFNNYLYCEEHGMKKYMKFTMFKKECEDKKYNENPYRAVNFNINEKKALICDIDKPIYECLAVINNYEEEISEIEEHDDIDEDSDSDDESLFDLNDLLGDENIIEEEIVEIGKRTTIDLGIHGLHPELVRLIGKMKYRSSYGQNLLQHARETANLCAVMASELGLNPKKAKRAGLLHDIGKVPDEETEMAHAEYGMHLAEKYKEKPDICNAIGAHHEEIEMQSLIAPIVQICDAISGARPGARREIVEAYIKRLKDLENIALSYPGVTKTYAIQAGRELRVIVGADKIDDKQTEQLSSEIAQKIQNEMTYPGQVKITVIRETRAVNYAR